MSILSDGGLPFQIDGYTMNPDFRNILTINKVVNDTELEPNEKTLIVLSLFYPDFVTKNIPVQDAMDGFLWFWKHGKEEEPADKQKPAQGGKTPKKGYDFEKDADYIYSSFCTAYGIRLASIDTMHWWEFMALFHGLPDDCAMKRIIYARTVDVSKLPKHEKQWVLKMRAIYSLAKQDTQNMSIEELNRKTQAYYDKRTGKA